MGAIVGRAPAQRAAPQRPILARNDSFRRNPSVLYDPYHRPSCVGLRLVCDSRYDVNNVNQAMFLQSERDPMVFAVAVSPPPGATNVNFYEDVTVHMIKTFTDVASVKISVNGNLAPVTISSHAGGIFANMVQGTSLVKGVDGFCHLHAEGVEDVSGFVFVDWTFTPQLSVAKWISLATGNIYFLLPSVWLAAGFIPIATGLGTFADGELFIRGALALLGEVTGRLFVGQVFLKTDTSTTFNIAELFLHDDGSTSFEIAGYAIFQESSVDWELYGIFRRDDWPYVFNIAAKQLTIAGSYTFEIAHAVRYTDGVISFSVLGEVSDFPLSRLVIRVSSMPPELLAELESIGILFHSDTPFNKILSAGPASFVFFPLNTGTSPNRALFAESATYTLTFTET